MRRNLGLLGINGIDAICRIDGTAVKARRNGHSDSVPNNERRPSICKGGRAKIFITAIPAQVTAQD